LRTFGRQYIGAVIKNLTTPSDDFRLLRLQVIFLLQLPPRWPIVGRAFSPNA